MMHEEIPDLTDLELGNSDMSGHGHSHGGGHGHECAHEAIPLNVDDPDGGEVSLEADGMGCVVPDESLAEGMVTVPKD